MGFAHDLPSEHLNLILSFHSVGRTHATGGWLSRLAEEGRFYGLHEFDFT
ncbi:hypothetical protein [Neisseria sicca]|nr:hypothetical protein [Neisseria sicca]